MPRPKRTPKPRPQPYPAAQLHAWMQWKGFTVRDAAERLGCSHNSLYAWLEPGAFAPPYIGLACTAVALGIGQWGVMPAADEAASVAGAKAEEDHDGA